MFSMDLTLNFHEWSRQNFFLQHQFIIKQTSDENKEKCQLGHYYMIQYQVFWTNVIRIVRQTVKRITKKILEVKDLT